MYEPLSSRRCRHIEQSRSMRPPSLSPQDQEPPRVSIHQQQWITSPTKHTRGSCCLLPSSGVAPYCHFLTNTSRILQSSVSPRNRRSHCMSYNATSRCISYTNPCYRLCCSHTEGAHERSKHNTIPDAMMSWTNTPGFLLQTMGW